MKKLAIIEDDRLFNEALYQFLVQSEYEIKRALFLCRRHFAD